MADQSYRPNTEENEYQYQEEQEGGDFKYSEDLPAKKRKINLKPIIIVVVILLAIFAGYKLLTHKRHVTPDTADELAAELAPTKEIPASAVVNRSVTTISPSEASNALQANAGQQVVPAVDVQKLQTLQEQTQDSINSLEKQQFQTQAGVMAMQQSIDQMTQQMQSVTQSLQVLNDDYQARLTKERQAIVAKQQAQALLRKTKQYFVNAVIPGRAWLKGADGTILTVVVGDNIPGYGKVLSINSYSGQVVTEKGVLPYGQS